MVLKAAVPYKRGRKAESQHKACSQAKLTVVRDLIGGGTRTLTSFDETPN